MRYRLIAVDLDGTLLDSQGRVSRRNLSALEAAVLAGVAVVPCTGRLWRESRVALEQLRALGPGVFAGGAVVSDMATGQSLDTAVIEPALAGELVRFLEDLPEAVLVSRESGLCGHDYLVTGNGASTASTRWWFEATGATVHFQEHAAACDLHHTLRVAVVTETDRAIDLCDRLRGAFEGRVLVHGFQAGLTPDPHQGVFVVEVFAAGVDKWRGLTWIADQRGIDRDQIVAIGDEINDVAMLQNAGCGIAMANAISEVKAVADHVTLGHQQDGVAHAIDQLLAGRWVG